MLNKMILSLKLFVARNTFVPESNVSTGVTLPMTIVSTSVAHKNNEAPTQQMQSPELTKSPIRLYKAKKTST